MKKCLLVLSILLTSVVIVALMNGCSKSGSVSTAVEISADEISSRVESETIVEIAQRNFEMFRVQNWSAFKADFGEKIIKKVSQQDWVVLWQQVISKAGKKKEYISTTAIVMNDKRVVEHIVRFEEVVYIFDYVFNDENEIVGFFIKNKFEASKVPPCFDGCKPAAERYNEAIRKGDWKYIHGASDDSLNASLTDENLVADQTLMRETLGKYVSILANDSQKEGDLTIVTVKNLHERGTLETTLKFNANAKVVSYDKRVVPDAAGDAQTDQTADKGVDAEMTREGIKISGDASFPVDGELIIPKNVDKPPVVIFLSGSGPNDMDSTIMTNKPFKDLAERLARNGIASLRYHKRTFMYGADGTDTIEDEYLEDANAAIQALRSDARIGKIYVLGHSMGGALAAYVANQSEDVAGAISVAGTLRNLDVLASEQINAQLEEASTTLSAEDYAVAEQQAKPILEQLQTLGNLTDDVADDVMLFYAPVKYWRSLRRIDVVAAADSISKPFYIAQGEADVQVSADRDYALWQEHSCNRNNVTCKLYPEHNHMMYKTASYKDGREYMENHQMSEEFVNDIVKFVKN